MVKKTIALIMALLFIVAVAVSCKPANNGEDPVVDLPGNVSPTPGETPTPAFVANEMQQIGKTGMLAAGALHTVGLRADGSLLSSGHDVYGQRNIRAWGDISFVAANEKLTVGVTSAGTLVHAGEIEETLAAAILEWTDIVAVALADGFIAGLKNDGTVITAGTGAADTAAWADIVAIAAGSGHVVGLKKDGSVVAAGDNGAGQTDVSAWSRIVSISAGSTHSVAVDADGIAYSTKDDINGWTRIVSIYAGGDTTLGIKEDGMVVAMPENAELLSVTDVINAAVSPVHIALMKADGTVVAFGNNDDLQCDVGVFRLRPYIVNNTMLRGFRLGSSVADVKALLKAQYGIETVDVKLDGAEMADTDIICTGASLGIGTATYTAIIIGDVNGDGAADALDVDAINAHVADEASLSGGYLAAAAVVHSFNGDVVKESATAIEAYVAGSGYFSQYGPARTGVYDELIAEVFARNEDVVGWISIPGTNISYPIMFDKTGKWYYNYNTVEKEKADRGSIYTYYKSFSQNNVVTGHNSRPSQVMFHYLHHIQEYNNGLAECVYGKCDIKLTDELPDLKNYSERVWTMELYGVESKWEVFSMYETKAGVDIGKTLYDNIWWPGSGKLNYTKLTATAIQEWIDKQFTNSEIEIESIVTVNDTFLTLFTCGNEKSDADRNARLYFFLKRVD